MGLQFSFVVVVLFLLQRKQSRSTNHYIQSLLCTSYSVHLKCEGQEPKKDRDVNRVHEVSRSNVQDECKGVRSERIRHKVQVIRKFFQCLLRRNGEDPSTPCGNELLKDFFVTYVLSNNSQCPVLFTVPSKNISFGSHRIRCLTSEENFSWFRVGGGLGVCIYVCV